jgi:winged helix DNA-binding protein
VTELGERQLNRALLARQLLLDRGTMPIPAALGQIAGIQAQYAPAMYVGLWSRLDALARDEVTTALEDRTAIQATLMRSTIHLVAAGDYWPFAVAVRRARREHWLRVRREHDAAQMAAGARRLRRRLAGGPMRRKEIEDLLGKDVALGVGLWLDMVRVPPSGTWERRRADLYAAAEDWLERERVTAATAAEHLIGSYLRGFGPASHAAVASFTGLKIGSLPAVLKRMELVEYSDVAGEALLDLPGAPLPDPDTPAPVRFLPVWDSTLLVHARRTAILPEELRPRVFHVKNPHGTPTFLVDGAVAGAWRYENGRVTLDPWRRLDRATRRAVDAEAERLAAFHA